MKIEQTPPREELIEALSIVGYSRDFADARVLPDGYDERCKEQQARNQKLRDQRRKERKLAAKQMTLSQKMTYQNGAKSVTLQTKAKR